jgi:tetratricopeptide (TPR) repeat protein
MRLQRATLVPLALCAALVPALVTVAARVAREAGADRPYEIRYLPQGPALRLLPQGLKLSLADAYWLATVQYIGGQHLAGGTYQQLYPLVDLVTDLDPRHGYAFQTAGIVLSSAGRLEESDAILKKGIERGPNWWSYPFYLAFNDYFFRGDYHSAARWAAQAARTPGASPNISQLALSLEVKGGDPEAGLTLLRELLQAATNEDVKARLEEQYQLARLQVDFARLDAAVLAFKAGRGRPPARLEELVEAGLITAIPPEPFGGRYELRADGKVHSTERDFRFSAREPGRLALKAAGGGTPLLWSAPPGYQYRWAPPSFSEPPP